MRRFLKARAEPRSHQHEPQSRQGLRIQLTEAQLRPSEMGHLLCSDPARECQEQASDPSSESQPVSWHITTTQAMLTEQAKGPPLTHSPRIIEMIQQHVRQGHLEHQEPHPFIPSFTHSLILDPKPTRCQEIRLGSEHHKTTSAPQHTWFP